MLGVHDSLRVVCEHAEAAAGWGPRTSDLAFSLLRAGSRLTTVTSRSAGPRLGRPPPRADYLLFVPVSAPSLRIYHRACLGIRQSATNTLAQRNTISQPKILRGRLVADWWLSSSGSPSTPGALHHTCHAMAAPYVHVWLHSAHAHSPRAAYAPRHPAWIVLAFLDRAGNLVLILTGPHAIDSCTACRSTDSFAATTGNVPPLSFGRTAHRRKHHYNIR
jgi:hypothetical protein